MGGTFPRERESACVNIVQVTQIPVRYAETDQMGVVHHSHYPVYFEVGRTEFFEQFLFHYAEMEKQGLRAPVLEVGFKILGAARYGHTLRLETRPEWFRGLRLEMGYRITHEDELIATGFTRHALLGADMRPVRKEKLGGLYDQVRAVFPERQE